MLTAAMHPQKAATADARSGIFERRQLAGSGVCQEANRGRPVQRTRSFADIRRVGYRRSVASPKRSFATLCSMRGESKARQRGLPRR